MHRDIFVSWEAHTVPAHFHDDIFPADNDLLRTVLDACGVAGEHSCWYSPAELFCQGLR